MKILRQNLDSLALLSGFDAAAARWNARQTSTLRFTEILAKIYGSSFTTGELLYLFSVDQHLGGDDPFFQQEENEALDQPFDFPEEGHPFDLWKLRERLLHIRSKDEDFAALTWTALSTAMRTEFGYDPPVGTDPLQKLGTSFPTRWRDRALPPGRGRANTVPCSRARWRVCGIFRIPDPFNTTHSHKSSSWNFLCAMRMCSSSSTRSSN